MKGRALRPSPALVVATIALFVALGGTAGAVVSQVVPRAKVADNAKKLGGKTYAQVVAAAAAQAAKTPGPASSAAGLVTIKTGTANLGVDGQGEFTVTCDPGQKVAGGGFTSDGAVFNLDSFPASDAAWRLYLVNGGSGPANITLYATCVR